MTCVIAIVEGGTVHAGADSAVGDPDEIYELHERKAFVRGPYLVGYCGSSLVGQILRYRVDFPTPPSKGDELAPFLVREVGPAIRRAVEAEGVGGSGRTFLGEKTVLILGCHARLWCMMPDLTIAEMKPFAAIGSGRHRAYGALHALTAAGVEPARRRIELALAATAAFTPSVRPPFHFVALPTPRGKNPSHATQGSRPGLT